MGDVIPPEVMIDMMKALLIPFVLGLAAPVYRLFDVRASRQEQLRRIEILKELSENDRHFFPDDAGLDEMYRERYRALMAGARQLHPMWPHMSLDQVREGEERRSPFNGWDVLCALLAPGVAALTGVVAMGGFGDEDSWGFLGGFVVVGAPSLLIARFVIARRLRSGFWQAFAQFFTGLFLLIPGYFVIDLAYTILV